MVECSRGSEVCFCAALTMKGKRLLNAETLCCFFLKIEMNHHNNC